MINKKFLNSISYSVGANLISVMIAILVITIMPKFMSLSEYGLWQLFLFYNSYVGICHIGISDGLYLKNIGKSYSDLDFISISNQILITVTCATIVAISMYSFFIKLDIDLTKVEVLLLVLITVPMAHFKCVCILLFQATNHIKEYALNSIIENMIFFMCLICLIIFDKPNFQKVYTSFFISLFISVVFIVYTLKDNLKISLDNFGKDCKESFLSFLCGSKLLLANIANTLIIGIVRYGISFGWSIVYFGKISLTLSLCNFLMTFVNSLSFVLIPNIKNLSQDSLDLFFLSMRKILNVVLFSLLVFYYPIYFIMKMWLPNYIDGLIYMSVLFPVCIYECRTGLLINSILKVLRKEELLFKINFIVLIISLIITIMNVILFKNLDFIVFSILLLYTLRCLIAEHWISKILFLNLSYDTFKETILVIIFLIANIKFSLTYSCLIYLVFLLAYIIYELENIKKSFIILKKIF